LISVGPLASRDAFTHPGVSQLQHKRPHFVFHRNPERFGRRLKYDPRWSRSSNIGDRSRERGLPAVRLAGLAGARLRPTLKRTGVCALEQMTVPGEQF
jgi:hypothetical protein